MDHQPPKYSVDAKLTACSGFARAHRSGTDEQISAGVRVLLDCLNAGEAISDSLIAADGAYKGARISAFLHHCQGDLSFLSFALRGFR